MTKGHLILAAIIAPVAITLLVVLGVVATVLAVLSPILWLVHRTRSAGAVKPSGGGRKTAPRKGSFKALLAEMKQPETEWK